ncbi:SPOR domain-containing protein [Aquimarina mytili]|uniref:SPOR domain-containing protein n=1 Tax=Aquimarina mytili TaxID=874423 RepID=A0A937A139_9FLAO|nr:SPOR domain-containing protein [Aquimarina mytili]MBL0683090.1 SPOR domain-containing protein [Aquimarina mytili]
MKVIKDEDLLSLHYQIEKAEIKQKKLEDLLDVESDKLKKSKKSNRLFGSFSLVLFLLAIFLVANSFHFSKTSGKNYESEELSLILEEFDAAKAELEKLKEENNNYKDIQGLYLYRNLINKDTIYSVQVKAFNDNKIATISNKFTNVLVYNNASIYKLSLGVFETLKEAQEFRKVLMQSGFDKKIFVISYKDGKRIRIEDFY